jgi:hypothetical protein
VVPLAAPSPFLHHTLTSFLAPDHLPRSRLYQKFTAEAAELKKQYVIDIAAYNATGAAPAVAAVVSTPDPATRKRSESAASDDEGLTTTKKKKKKKKKKKDKQ